MEAAKVSVLLETAVVFAALKGTLLLSELRRWPRVVVTAALAGALL